MPVKMDRNRRMKNRGWKAAIALLTAAMLAGSAAGCGAPASGTSDTQQGEQQGTEISKPVDWSVPEIGGMVFDEEEQLDYAECFRIYRCEEGYSVIKVDDGTSYLVVPEEAAVPEELPADMVVLQQPLDNIYLVATSAMSLFDAVGAVDQIRLSGTDADGWYIQSAADAMAQGEMLYAGKYSEPDFEMMLQENCDLAVESTMILHTPDVKEKIEELGIPVFIDRSSYESHPLGRVEWLKLYGELTGKMDAAREAFDVQKAYVEDLSDLESTGKTVAFFFVNQNGVVVTRKTNDYLPRMIELAGGKYNFDTLGEDDETALSSVNMTMEEFYASAKDVDYIIYNATIETPLDSIDDLLRTSELLADFKAVKEGNVWCTDKYLYQGTSILGGMVQDIHTMLTDENAEELTFMYRLH